VDGKRDNQTEAMLLIYEIDREEPFHAFGFFNIERSTLTSLVGTILTYLIVLVQFQPSTESSPTKNVTETTPS
jgi:hypothetical protein